MAPAPFLTVDEYLRTPETLQPTELVYGALRVADAPTVQHQQVLGAFYLALAIHAREHRLGTVLLAPTDVILDHDRALILQPDLVFVSNARQHLLKSKVVGAPDLVLEVLSPHPRVGRLEERLAWFAEYGVREVWLLHQIDRRFEILSVTDRHVADRKPVSYFTPITSTVLPDFRMTVEEILRV